MEGSFRNKPEKQDSDKSQIKKLQQEIKNLQSQIESSTENKLLEERIRIEKAVFKVSSFFIGEYNLDDAIHQSFQLLGPLAGADRIYMYRMHQKAKLIHLTYEQIISDPDSIPKAPANISYSKHKWLTKQLRTNEILHIGDVSNLPGEAINEKKLFSEQGVKSIVAFPILIRGELDGYLGLDYISRQKKWLPQDLKIFKIAADIISFSIERKRSEKSLRRSEQMYENIYENTGAATLTLKPDSTILMVNSEFERLTGYPRNEVEGQMSLLELVKKEDRSVIQNYLMLVMCNPDAAPDHYEFRYVSSDGNTRDAFMTGSTMLDTKTAIISFIDISDFKITEKQLLDARDKAEESDRLKSAFLANVSHEIRTPLNAITGFSSLLSASNLTSDKKEKYIKQILNGSNELINLIDNVLDISRIESGNLKPKMTEFLINITLRELRDFFNDMKLQHGKENLDIILKLPPGTDKLIVRTDQSRLQQVLTNLIENSMKFTSSGMIEFGYSYLSAEPDDTDTESILFFVKDSGIGIAKKEKDRIFERFVKVVDRSDYLYRGAGLGLALCRDIVKLLNGEIWVESALGKGSTFYFTLPCRKSRTKKTGDKAKRSVKLDFSEKTILIAEDTESNFLYLKEILNSTNATILRALTGREAVKLFRENKNSIDLNLMDILMPEYDGFEAATKIRDIKNDIIILAQTAFAFEGEFHDGLYAGCFNDYILKPFDIKVIRRLLEKYLLEES